MNIRLIYEEKSAFTFEKHLVHCFAGQCILPSRTDTQNLELNCIRKP